MLAQQSFTFKVVGKQTWLIKDFTDQFTCWAKADIMLHNHVIELAADQTVFTKSWIM